MKNKSSQHEIFVSDSITVQDSLSMTLESNYLLISSREKLASLLSKQNIDRNDIIDIFIALHLVLELGINHLFRKIIIPTLKKNIDTHVMIDNLDGISFIDKTIMFIYYSKFNFGDIDEASEHHSIINKLRAFSEMRNKILHGHSVSEISKDGESSSSNLRKNLTSSKLFQQIEYFKSILKGLSYYLDSLELDPLTLVGKEQLKTSYLDYSFIPENISFPDN